MTHSPEEARALHDQVPVLDLHADTPLLMRRGYDFLSRHRPFVPGGALFGHVDLPRMRESGMTAQMFGLVTLPYLQRGLMKEAEKQIACVEEAVDRSAGALRMVANAEELREAHARGQKAVLLSLEGIQAVDRPQDRPGHVDVLEALSTLCHRGVRSVGLVHFTRNSAATPGLASGDATTSLTPLGFRIIEALEQWGCLVDLAHLNRRGFLDAARHMKSPPIVSHTGLLAFRDLKRNIDNEQIRAVADKGGVVGIMYSRQFLGSADMERVVEEFKHLLNVGGEDALALGSDFDGAVIPPRGLDDICALPRLTAALWNALGERATRKLLGENFLRVLQSTPLRVGRWAGAQASAAAP
ncbi:MAG: membrane dipeptidase [Myxococcota bacterium]